MEHTHLCPVAEAKRCGERQAAHRSTVSGKALTKQLSRCYEHIQQDSVREKTAELGNLKLTFLTAILAETRMVRRKSWRQRVLSEGGKAPRAQGMKGGTRRASTQDWGRADLAQRGGEPPRAAGWALARSHPCFKDLFGST